MPSGKYQVGLKREGLALRLFVLSIFFVATTSAFGADDGVQDPLIIQFGRAIPSVPGDGRLVHVEDSKAGVSVETFADLPKALAPIYGLHINEVHFTTAGVPAGRRLSIFNSEDAEKPELVKRLAYFDFDEEGRLERYSVIQDPKTWFRAERFEVKAETPETDKFFHQLLFESDHSPLPLNVVIEAPRQMNAPRGLLSPQLVRPALKVPRVAGQTSQLAFQVSRTYSDAGKMVRVSLTLSQLLANDEGEMLGHKNALTIDAETIGEDGVSSIFLAAKPCHRVLKQLRMFEKG